MINSISFVFRHDVSNSEQSRFIELFKTSGFDTWTRPNSGTSLMCCIGGDGTFLRGVQLRPLPDIPVLGINVGGHLGYLTAETDVVRAINFLKTGAYIVKQRTMIQGTISKVDEAQGVVPDVHLEALNEIVVRAENNKPLEMDVSIAGATIESVFGDGLLVSTPTGSTAYNLSAGGPLILPESQTLIVTPIAPIDLNFRPLVFPDDQEIILTLASSADHAKYVFADKQEVALSPGRYTIRIQKLQQPLSVIEFPSVKSDFFQIFHERTLGHRKSVAQRLKQSSLMSDHEVRPC